MDGDELQGWPRRPSWDCGQSNVHGDALGGQSVHLGFSKSKFVGCQFLVSHTFDAQQSTVNLLIMERTYCEVGAEVQSANGYSPLLQLDQVQQRGLDRQSQHC